MSKWDGKTKGKVLGYKFFVFFIKFFGVSFAYLVLRFVTYYYYLFQKNAKSTLIRFYMDYLDMDSAVARKTAKRNFYVFGQVLVDRIAFLAGKESKYTYSFENEEAISLGLEDNNGIILVSGHVGNWETAGNLLQRRLNHPINVVMYDEEAKRVKEFLDSTTKIKKFNIIPLKDDISHVIMIHNALRKNEIIALHGDRYMDETNTLNIPFLGKDAKFPEGPFIVASKFRAPFTFVFAVKTGKYHYHFSATRVTYSNDSAEIARQYVHKLEQMTRDYPEQWFNYFEFHK